MGERGGGGRGSVEERGREGLEVGERRRRKDGEKGGGRGRVKGRGRRKEGGGGVGGGGGGVVEGRGGRRAWEIEGQCGGEREEVRAAWRRDG